MRIRKKLPLYIMLLISIPLLTLSFVLYVYSSGNLIRDSKGKLSSFADVESNLLEQLIKDKKTEIELMARQEKVVYIVNNEKEQNKNDFDGHLGKDGAVDYLKDIVKNSNGMLADSFITDFSGNIIASSSAKLNNVNVSDRNYFINSISGQTLISDMIDSQYLQEKVMVISTPIVDDSGRIIGIMGNILDANYLNKFRLIKEVGEKGYSYIIDAKGNIISHPDTNIIGTRSENEELLNYVKNIKTDEDFDTKIDIYTYKGTPKLMAFKRLKEVDWIIVVTQEISEIRSPALTTSIIIGLTTVFLVILSLIFSLKLSMSITKPIEKIISTMGKAADGDLSAQCDYESKDELGQLATSYNVMLDRLNLSYEEMASVYEQLAATEEELRAQYDELQASEEALRNSEEKYRMALESANDAIWEWNTQTGSFFASDKWDEIMAMRRSDRINIRELIEEKVHLEDRRRLKDEFKAHINGEKDFFRCEIRIIHELRGYTWVRLKGKAIFDEEGKAIKITGSAADISERKKAQSEIEHMAYYDSLTGLPNKAYFIKKLNEQIAPTIKNRRSGAVLFIDLDNFKNINDTLGHDYGDLLLQNIVERLNSIKKASDIICRFGGDEFIILRMDFKDTEEIKDYAEKILNIFNDSISLKEKSIHITGSVGITIYPSDGNESNTILKNADTALFNAKGKGKNRYEIFHSSMYDELERKVELEELLRNALANNEFKVVYQPQYDIRTRKIIGFEALLRLNSRKKGFISPAEFIPVAEESGFIIQIGEWVLREACRKNAEWKSKGYNYENISVNISSIQLQQPDFKDMVRNILDETGLRPEFLELEITESVLMKSIHSNVNTLNELRSMGIKISLDDFGTGYSSLNYLKLIPIDTLKIDKSFIDEITLNHKEKAIAKAIIEMAHTMELSVIAEGVEKEEQLEILVDKACDKVQGYLFSKPINEEQVEQLFLSDIK